MTARPVRCLIVALTVTACASPKLAPSDEPGSTVAPSAASPTAAPTLTPQPPATAEATASPAVTVGGVAQVVTTDLVMRSAPGGGDDSVVFPGALDAPILLFVVDGPTSASGYDWYLVDPFSLDSSERPEHWRLAWVAAGSPDGETWIAPATLDCHEPDLDELMGLPALAALACIGDAPLVVEGSYGGCSYIVPGVITPSWLGSSFCWLRPVGTSTDALVEQPWFVFHISSSGIPALGFEPGTHIRIVGHFDDPAAQTCAAGPLPGPGPTPAPAAEELLAAQAVVLGCRARFVVTESEPVLP